MSILVVVLLIIGIIVLSIGLKRKNKKAYIASGGFFVLSLLGIVAMFMAGSLM